MFGLCSTFCYKFAWCDVCFGRCGGRAAAGTPTPRLAPLLEDRPGQVLQPLQHWRADAQSLGGFRRWNALPEGLRCRGPRFALKCHDFNMISVAGAGSSVLSPRKSIASLRWQGQAAHGLMGLFHFNFYSKMTLCYCSQTRRQPSRHTPDLSFFSALSFAEKPLKQTNTKL